MAIRKHRSKEGFDLPKYDYFGLVTYGRYVDRSKGKFARKVRRSNERNK